MQAYNNLYVIYSEKHAPVQCIRFMPHGDIVSSNVISLVLANVKYVELRKSVGLIGQIMEPIEPISKSKYIFFDLQKKY